VPGTVPKRTTDRRHGNPLAILVFFLEGNVSIVVDIEQGEFGV